MGVWVFNLEDGTDELERQMAASCSFYGIGQPDCGDRLHVDSGMVQRLCTATEDRDGFLVNEEAFEQLAARIQAEPAILTAPPAEGEKEMLERFEQTHAMAERLAKSSATLATALRQKRRQSAVNQGELPPRPRPILPNL